MKNHLGTFGRAVLGAGFIAFTVSTQAATITVTNLADSGAGSLRAALAAATNGDIINASGLSGTITLTNGELLVSKSVTIFGPGPGILAVNGNFPNTTNRVFDVQALLTVTIMNLTITNGHFPGGSGGGIYNYRSTLTVSNCVLRGNSAQNGGAIYNNNSGGSGSLTVRASIVDGNSAAYGGGIYNDGGSFGSALLSVIASTFRSNSAPFGGGIYNTGRGNGNAPVAVSDSSFTGNTAFIDESIGGGAGGAIYNDGEGSGSATISILRSTFNGNSANFNGGVVYNDGYQGSASLYVYTSTFSGNSADFSGGGIANVAPVGIALVAVNASTFSGNSAVQGGVLYNDHGTFQIGDTILNAGASGTNLFNINGSIFSVGYNLSSDGGGGFLIGTNDHVNTAPLLGPLADNGGPTLTHALLRGSPAIDQGKRDAVTFLALDTDQRGKTRPLDLPSVTNVAGGDGSDIGAFEFIPPPQFISIAALADHTVALQGAGLSNSTYTIQANSNLNTTNWTVIGTAPANGSGAFSFTDTNAPSFPMRFYRALSP